MCETFSSHKAADWIEIKLSKKESLWSQEKRVYGTIGWLLWEKFSEFYGAEFWADRKAMETHIDAKKKNAEAVETLTSYDGDDYRKDGNRYVAEKLTQEASTEKGKRIAKAFKRQESTRQLFEEGATRRA